jgi:hypothetical protein
MLLWLRELFDYLGGAADRPPPGFPEVLKGPLFWGTWWALLAVLIVLFSGQTSKFIYIDF